MPLPDQAYDFLIDGKGYMLSRRGRGGFGGRNWYVESINALTAGISSLSPEERLYSAQPTTIEAVMAWRDLSAGYGDDQQIATGRYNYTVNMDARFKGKVIPGPLVSWVQNGYTSSPVVDIVEFDGHIYFAAGQYVFLLNDDFSLDIVLDMGSGKECTDLCVFDDALLAAAGYDDGLWETEDGALWVQSTSVKVKYMAALSDRLWASFSDNTVCAVASGTDPLDIAEWTSSYIIGDSSCAITGLQQQADYLYITKEDGLYSFDSDGNAFLTTPELKPYADSNNGHGLISWHGLVWVPHIRGLLAYQNLGDNGFNLYSYGPERGLPKENPASGYITALAGDGNWLYATIYNSAGETYLLAGKEDNSLGMVWHPIAYLGQGKCHSAAIVKMTSRICLLLGMSTGKVGVIYLPRYSDNPLNDSGYRYATSGALYLPAHTWGAYATTKTWTALEIEADNVNAVQYLDAYCRVDGGSWIYLGRASRSPKSVIDITRTYPSGLSGQKIELRLDFSLYGEQSPIIIKGVYIRGTERPRMNDIVTALVRCADNLPLRNGAICPRGANEILNELKALSSSPRLVEMKDVSGAIRKGFVLSPVLENPEYDQTGNLERELTLTVRFAVVYPEENTLTEVVLFQDLVNRAFMVPMAVPVFTGNKDAGEVRIPLNIPLLMARSISFSTTYVQVFSEKRARLIFYGPLVSPTVTNVTTGKKISFDGIEIGAGNFYVVDMLSTSIRCVDAYGNDISGCLSSDSAPDSFSLTEGQNTFTVTCLDSSYGAKITLEY